MHNRIIVAIVLFLTVANGIAQQHDKPGCNLGQTGGVPICSPKNCPQGCGIYDIHIPKTISTSALMINPKFVSVR